MREETEILLNSLPTLSGRERGMLSPHLTVVQRIGVESIKQHRNMSFFI